MNLDRIKLKATAGAVTVAAVVLLAVALGLFLYWWLKTWFDPAVAAGLSFLLFAALFGVAGAVIRARAASDAPSSTPATSSAHSLPERAIDLVRSRPIAALALGAVVVTIAMRNPALVAALAGAALNRARSSR